MVLATLSVLIGVLPGLVPGVPEHNYYSLSAVRDAIFPLGAALGLWFLVGDRLTRKWPQHGEHEEKHPEPVLREMLTRWSHGPLSWLRKAHRIDAQLALQIAVAASLFLVVLLVLVM